MMVIFFDSVKTLWVTVTRLSLELQMSRMHRENKQTRAMLPSRGEMQDGGKWLERRSERGWGCELPVISPVNELEDSYLFVLWLKHFR